ncbi:MAG TPA: hypothetical protein VHA75_00165 [Rugosimonospora sp.]|nr:hypothetical protein [Rugosimonospora sp.]
MDFSLFDEAARDYDAEAAERRTAMVRVAVKEDIFPFLAMASTDAEYRHRKALAAERLHTIARRCEASLADVEETADRMYRTLLSARQKLAGARAQAPTAMRTTSVMGCKNCDHASVDHSEGLACGACGCTNFTPKSSGKEARRVTAEGEESGPFS